MDYEKAADYWKNKDRDAVKMDREELLQRIETFLNTRSAHLRQGREISSAVRQSNITMSTAPFISFQKAD